MTVSFNKNRQRWVYNFQLRDVRYQGYCVDASGQPVASKSAAKQAEGVARRRADIAPKLPRGEDVTLSLVIAGLQPRWMREGEWENKKRNAREIVQFFGARTLIASIDEGWIQRYIEFCSTRPIMVWIGGQKMERDADRSGPFWRDTGRIRSPSTVNRRLAVLRLIIGAAAKIRDPESGQPVLPHVPKFEDMPEPKRRARPTPEPVMQRLLEILPRHTIDAMTITLYFGFRRGEAFGLKEEHVDWQAQGVRLFAEDVKDDEDAFLPGSQEGMGYLRCLAMEAEDRGVRHLISYRHPSAKRADLPWRAVKNSRTAWKTAMKVIEREFGRRWRWHDLRAAFITHVAIMAGPLAAQTLARHADFDTTRGYIEVANTVTRGAAEMAAERPALRVVGRKSADESC